MCPDTIVSAVTAAEFSGQSERRHGSRTPFSLLYPCVDSGQMLIGDGVVSDLSSRGIAIRGNQSVAPVGDRHHLYRPSRDGRAILHYPEQSFLG